MADVTVNLSLPRRFFGILPFKAALAGALDTIDAAVGNVLTGTKTAYDPASLADGASATTTVTVTGAALGDCVIGLSFSLDLQGVELSGYVSAADTVTAYLRNNTGGAVDLGSGTLTAVVRQAA